MSVCPPRILGSENARMDSFFKEETKVSFVMLIRWLFTYCLAALGFP